MVRERDRELGIRRELEELETGNTFELEAIESQMRHSNLEIATGVRRDSGGGSKRTIIDINMRRNEAQVRSAQLQDDLERRQRMANLSHPNPDRARGGIKQNSRELDVELAGIDRLLGDLNEGSVPVASSNADQGWKPV